MIIHGSEKGNSKEKKAWNDTISLDSNSSENWQKEELPIILFTS